MIPEPYTGTSIGADGRRYATGEAPEDPLPFRVRHRVTNIGAPPEPFTEEDVEAAAHRLAESAAPAAQSVTDHGAGEGDAPAAAGAHDGEGDAAVPLAAPEPEPGSGLAEDGLPAEPEFDIDENDPGARDGEPDDEAGDDE